MYSYCYSDRGGDDDAVGAYDEFLSISEPLLLMCGVGVVVHHNLLHTHHLTMSPHGVATYPSSPAPSSSVVVAGDSSPSSVPPSSPPPPPAPCTSTCGVVVSPAPSCTGDSSSITIT